MMKLVKRYLSGFLVLIMLASLLAGCGGSANTSGSSSGANGGTASSSSGDGQPDGKNLKGEIIVGGWPSADKAIEAIIPEFNKIYPNIKVKLEMQKSADHHNKLLTSLAAGAGAPDVVDIESAYIGKFRDKGGFVNLLDEPYNAKRFEKDFVDYKYQMGISVDGKQMIALPWDIGPLTLFYRRDIFKEVGLPDEPAEVQKLVSTWEGYLEVARKVSKPGERWAVGNAADLFMAPWSNRDFYNEDLSLRFDNQESLDLIEIASTVREEGMDAKVTNFTNEWSSLMKEGKIVTQIAGGWFGGFLKSWVAPETSGKWGVVRVPGTVTNWGGSFLAIPEQSKNKEAAWAFIEFALTNKQSQNAMFKAVDYFPALKSAWDDPMYHEADPFFGNQNTREFWIEVSKDTKPSFITNMDKQTEEILKNSVHTGLDQGLSAREILDKAIQEIMNATKQDRQVMAELIEKGKK